MGFRGRVIERQGACSYPTGAGIGLLGYLAGYVECRPVHFIGVWVAVGFRLEVLLWVEANRCEE